ncbi:MAG: SMC family ATPase [Chloroflexota bacterium]|nr:SMC family ATPase [Chloroflexota bacterium]MDE2883755.1 SMC family ATPase [Chloroflexota bacterium]
MRTALLPISLSLSNFLSYRDAAPTLHLEGIRVACLCGPNGNGKSALLDAVTWALWGKARGQRHEQLLHHGQTEMRVELVFDVGSERYRVSRRYSQARRNPQSSLELAVQTAGGEFRAITGDTIRATESEIERIINMDYGTFVNSAFLVQGRADEFTMATPSVRKDVLAKVLGLGRYDELAERARLRGRDARARLDANAINVDRLRERAARAGDTRGALAEAERDLAEAVTSVNGLAERLQLLRDRVAHLERRQIERDEQDAQARRARQRQTDEETEAATLNQRLVGWQRTIERASEIDQGVAALEAAREHAKSLAGAAQQAYALQTELAPLESAIVHARARLESDIQAQRQHIDTQLMPRAESLPSLQRAQDELTERQAATESRRNDAAQAEESRRQLELEAQTLRLDNEQVEQNGRELRSKLNVLGHEHADGTTCPLCSTQLGPDGVERIRTAYESEIEGLLQRHKVQKQRVEELERQAGEAAAGVDRAQRELAAEQQHIAEEQSRLAVRVEEAERAGVQLKQAVPLLRENETALANGAYAHEAQAAARGLQERLVGLSFDPAALNAAEMQVQGLAHWEEERLALVAARDRMDDDAAALERARVRASEAASDAARAEQASAAIADELAELPSWTAQRSQVQEQLRTASAARDGLQALKGSLENEMHQIEQAAADLAEAEAQRDTLTGEASAYAELALAFGKGGVQALLMEAAIPRLEDEANDLLRRMTDGRMTLKLETQKERRSGGDAVETLEIVIADELGSRAYEMFSGGERFRIDFAVRIALSKVLAWRSGAPLPTLFIDEGFGTQDAEGRDRILEVIQAIEDRFERILVITHMDDIKEAFPVRIEVSRGADGSTFSLS